MHAFALGTDHAGLEILTHEESLCLLRSQPIGRVALMSSGEPVILPVNHAVDGNAIVFRTGHGTKLEAAWNETVVAFEVDDYDLDTRAGWSVLVRGRAEQITDERECHRLDALGVDTWVQGSSHWVRIHIDDVSGRRLVPA